MPISELGWRMSNYELNVTWPAYLAMKRREAAAEEEKQRTRKGRR